MVNRRGFLARVFGAVVAAVASPALAALGPSGLQFHPDAFAMVMEPLSLTEYREAFEPCRICVKMAGCPLRFAEGHPTPCLHEQYLTGVIEARSDEWYCDAFFVVNGREEDVQWEKASCIRS